MYIRKSTLLIGGVIIGVFIVGNIYLAVKEHNNGEKITIKSVIELAREIKKAYSAL